MAIHAVCEFCRHKISVPDKMKGKKVDCTACGKKTRLLTSLELDVEKAKKEEEKNRAKKSAGVVKKKEIDKPSVEELPKKIQKNEIEHLSRFPELRNMRSVFIVFSYLIGLFLIAVGLVFLFITGFEKGILLLLGFFLLAVLSFFFLRLVAESAYLGAELGDMEARMLKLLFEIRDKLENLGR